MLHFDRLHFDHRPGRRALLPAAAATALLLAACSAAASPSEPPASAAAGGRCSVTLAPHADATIEISGTQFGDEVTIAAGGAVEFLNQDGFGHTVTEGTGGTAAADACVDESIAGGASLVVTFTEPGDYQITCKIHSSMQTAIHVE